SAHRRRSGPPVRKSARVGGELVGDDANLHVVAGCKPECRRRRLAIEDHSYLRSNRGVGKWLRHKSYAFVETSIMDNRIARVAGGEQHLQLRHDLQRLVSQLATVQARK